MKTGLVLGRFLPPHLGHQYLIDFARNYVDEVFLVISGTWEERFTRAVEVVEPLLHFTNSSVEPTQR